MRFIIHVPNSFSPILTSEGRLEKKEQPLSLLENKWKWQRWGEEQSHSTQRQSKKSVIILHLFREERASTTTGTWEKSQITASSFSFKDVSYLPFSRANENFFFLLPLTGDQDMFPLQAKIEVHIWILSFSEADAWIPWRWWQTTESDRTVTKRVL